MLYNLSLQGKAPKIFSKLSSRQVPSNGILFSVIFLLIGVALNYLVPAKVFTYVTSVATFGAIWVWAIILLIQLKFRSKLSPAEVKNLAYPMPHYPFSGYISIAFLIFVTIVMYFNEDTRIALYIAPVWFGILYLSYYLAGFNKDNNDDIAVTKIDSSLSEM